jgi:hypothetical protein
MRETLTGSLTDSGSLDGQQRTEWTGAPKFSIRTVTPRSPWD